MRDFFATRTPQRPNAIGLSLVEVDRVKHDVLYLRGADLIDGTPILDIKPFLPHIDKPRTSVGNTEQADVQASMPSWLVGSLNDERALQFPIRVGPIKGLKRSLRMGDRLSLIIRPLKNLCRWSAKSLRGIQDRFTGRISVRGPALFLRAGWSSCDSVVR